MSWSPPTAQEWPQDTCQHCGRVLTRGGMLCAACQYGSDDAPAQPEPKLWPEQKVVVYDSGYGLIVVGFVWSQDEADRLLKRWEHLGQTPYLATQAEVKTRLAEERVGHPVQYRPRRKP